MGNNAKQILARE